MTRLIDEVRMIVMLDPKDDTEGVVAFRGADGFWLPLVAADPERFEEIEKIGRMLAAEQGNTFKVISLTTRTEVGEITPEDWAK